MMIFLSRSSLLHPSVNQTYTQFEYVLQTESTEKQGGKKGRISLRQIPNLTPSHLQSWLAISVKISIPNVYTVRNLFSSPTSMMISLSRSSLLHPFSINICKDQHHCLKSTVNISVQIKLETMESQETMESTLARQRIRSTFIRDLIRFQVTSKMKARVSRLWRPKKYKSDKNDGVHYVLVDEKGDAIHAVIDEKHYPHVNKKMEEGHVYEIFQFHTKEDTSNYKVIDRRPQIHLNRRTKFFEVEDTFPPIPRHAFVLLEFDKVKAAMENQKVLIDLYGCLKSVVPEYQVAVKNENRMESKCEVILENLRREDVGITLWGHNARRFDVEAIQKHPAPLLIVFTSLKIGLFQNRISPSTTQHTCFIIDPSIPQREEYMKEFSKPGDKVKIIPNSFRSPTQEEVKDFEKISVSHLNALNPKSYTTKMVYCAAWICRFLAENNWWYKGCPACYKQLRQTENSDHFSCTEHHVQIPLPCYRLYMTIEDVDNEATVVLIGKEAEQIFGATCQELVTKRLYPDEETLPEEIENTIGQKYVFRLKVKQNGELIVRDIYPDPQDSLPSTELGSMTTTTDYPPSQKEKAIETAEKPLSVFSSAKRLKREAQHQTATSSSINDQHT